MLENDKIVYFDYNIETAIKTFNDKSIEFNYIALLPPTMKELADRLRKRGTDNEDSIRKRIKVRLIINKIISKIFFQK